MNDVVLTAETGTEGANKLFSVCAQVGYDSPQTLTLCCLMKSRCPFAVLVCHILTWRCVTSMSADGVLRCEVVVDHDECKLDLVFDPVRLFHFN